MKVFQQRQLHEAIAHATTGGQALHLFDGRIAHAIPTAPKVFLNQKVIGHLFDQDKARLTKTARALGVRVVFIDRNGTPSQHIDLCGKPLQRAIKLATSTSAPDGVAGSCQESLNLQ